MFVSENEQNKPVPYWCVELLLFMFVTFLFGEAYTGNSIILLSCPIVLSFADPPIYLPVTFDPLLFFLIYVPGQGLLFGS